MVLAGGLLLTGIFVTRRFLHAREGARRGRCVNNIMMIDAAKDPFNAGFIRVGRPRSQLVALRGFRNKPVDAEAAVNQQVAFRHRNPGRLGQLVSMQPERLPA